MGSMDSNPKSSLFSFSCPLIIVIPLSLSMCIVSISLFCDRGAVYMAAQKIKHFAQREIEMQRTKKERENRKARYVKEAGGLKYTAIAMANRS